MEPAIDSQSRPLSNPGRIVLVPVAILVLIGLLIGYQSGHSGSGASLRRIDPGSEYRNTRPGVGYLGDESCVGCHKGIVESYRSHPMGRSIAPIASAPLVGSEQSSDRPLFDAQGLEYWMEKRDGQVIHKETRRDPSGRLISQNEGTVRYVVGSGKLGFAYLIERDGFLFQSPIAWYARAIRWDLPPGYQGANAHFDRPIQPSCLYCHANHVSAVQGTVNRFKEPIFQGHAIGCERCHGPGELHVQRPKAMDGRDLTIVNPAALEPSLRDSVCQQCHLNGKRRILRAGRRDDDFRPGLPFQRFWTVLEPATNSTENKFVGQFEQMHESRCFQASQGRLGCISCHDPHRLPDAQRKSDYFRSRCLNATPIGAARYP